jgi:hypothetical protein
MAKGKNKSRADPDEPPKKRGNPSQFSASRLEFLQDRIPEYLRHSKKKTTDEFWADLMHDYWRKFPWRVPLLEEPPPPDPEAAVATSAEAEAAFKALDRNLTDEEHAMKSNIQKETKKLRAFIEL